jgi:hypothetical protein
LFGRVSGKRGGRRFRFLAVLAVVAVAVVLVGLSPAPRTSASGHTHGLDFGDLPVSVNENGGTDSYKVELEGPPTGNVTVTLSDPSGQVTFSPGSLAFTPGNYSTHQHVTVQAVNDIVVEGSHTTNIIHTCASSDGGYNALTDSASVNITDNDTGSLVIVESGGSTNVTEGGATDTYTVALGKQPASNVTVTLTPNAEVTVNPVTLAFTPANWGTPRTVTVTAVDDPDVEGAHEGRVDHSCGGVYAGVTEHFHPAVTDNDFPSLVITETGGSTDVTEGGATDTYTVRLGARPASNVTVTLTPDARVTVNKATLTFTHTNWNEPQTVTVTAVNDAVVEGPHTGYISHVCGCEAPWVGISAGLDVHITDNDEGGLVIAETDGSTNVTEGALLGEPGYSDTYTVTLNTQPASDVTVTLTPDAQVTVNPPTLTFTSGNWNTPQPVTVTAVDDAVVEGSPHPGHVDHACSGVYAGVTAHVDVSVTDNDEGGLVITETDDDTAVDEEGLTSDTYSVCLAAEPSGCVDVTITPDDQVTVEGSTVEVVGVLEADGQGNGDGSVVLHFCPDNWDEDQTITVWAIDDDIVEGTPHHGYITHVTSLRADGIFAADAIGYEGVTSTLEVDITDNDDGGLVITSTGDDTAVNEEGLTSDTYSVRLAAEPSGEVAVTIATDEQVTVAGSDALGVLCEDGNVVLYFTPDNWDNNQSVTVTAVDDPFVEGTPHYGYVTHTTAVVNGDDGEGDCESEGDERSGDFGTPNGYDGVTEVLEVDITDNDEGGLVITETDGDTAVNEQGPTSDTYSVRLAAEPSGCVDVTITPDDQVTVEGPVVEVAGALEIDGPGNGDGSVVLHFCPDNWDEDQTITVRAVDDDIVEGTPHHGYITHVTSLRADGIFAADAIGYEGVTSTLEVDITDNDTAAVQVSPTTLSLAEGASGQYTVVLLREPTSDVTITVTPVAGLTTDKGTLTFTTINWAAPQTVTVTATPDTVYTGPRTLAVTHAASGDNYSSVSVASVVVSVADDELAPVVVEEEEDGCCSPPSLRGPWLLSRDLVNHWSYEEATLALNLGIIPGNSKGLWVPSGRVTRAEFLTWLNRAAGFPWENAPVTFKDVKPSDAFYRDLQTAVAVGTALGYPDGTFRPGQLITREEAGAMVAKALVHCGRSPVESDLTARLILGVFRDGKDVSRTFLRDVALVVYHEVMVGQGAQSLVPNGNLTRAEAAEMLVRFWRMLRMR